MKHDIPLNQFGRNLTVWERRDSRTPKGPRYYVQNHETCRILEEFRRQSSANKWASENCAR